ncbi:MAG TPA: tripartite tricarboxylate transporter substrate-binding protein [Xanthobacteraceae bacterium]|nr:tripartite tricarboxylate transporter substrate-binding protein [Xanthobacteraceae bacterium]
MRISRRQFLHLATGAAILPATTSVASTQGFPTRPVTIIVPFPAGGPADVIARIIGDRMRTSLGQPVIVENVSGAGGTIGVARAARATPDGYTLSMGQLNSHVFSGAAYSVRYDLLKDFDPVALLTTNPLMIAGRKDFPAKNIRGLVAWLKANPDKASFATPGVGSPSHVWGIYFQNITGTRFQFVAYRGAAPAMQDLLSAQVDLTCLQASDLLPQVRGGNVRAYAILATTAWARAPDIPIVDEAGVAGLHMPFWHGLWAPVNTPREILGKLNRAAIEAVGDSSVRQRLADIGQEIFPREQQTPEALAALQKAEIEKWWPIIKSANIKGE